MLSRTAHHAIQAVARLALLPPGEYAGATALAEKTGAPANYLGKLLQGMVGRGLLESRRGLRGGFRLARDPGRITLLEIVDPIDDLSGWNGCFLGRMMCSEEDPCAVHDQWVRMRQNYLGLLGLTTVAQIVSTWRVPEGGRES
jgi:Rrf2 family iron-sulfur cluster assembly transcriptional regulator